MIKFDEFQELQDAIDQEESAKQRDVGVLSQLERTLRKEHGCKNRKEAERLLKRLQLKQKQEKTQHAKDIVAFKRKYRKELDSL